jgi:DNA-binding NarL/FixJ family response regulator
MARRFLAWYSHAMTHRKALESFERDKQILELLAEGLRVSAIAKRLSLQRDAIDRRIRLLGSDGTGRLTAALEEASRKKGRLRDY